jgi:hypothetical protein
VERGFGVRAALGVSDRGHTAAAAMKPGDVDWDAIFGGDGARWFHCGGIFAALAPSTAEALSRRCTRHLLRRRRTPARSRCVRRPGRSGASPRRARRGRSGSRRGAWAGPRSCRRRALDCLARAALDLVEAPLP